MVGLPHDLQYCLDCMIELHEITSDVYEYFFSIKSDAVNFLDNNGTDKNLMIDDYQIWRKKATPIQKAYLTLTGIEGIKHQKHDYIMSVANDTIIKHKRKPTQKMLAESLLVGTVQERFHQNFERLYFQAKKDFNDVSLRDVLNFNKKILEDREHFFNLNHPWREIQKPKEKNIDKKVLKKSVALMGNFFTENDTRLFLGKKEVTITGQNFNFAIKSENLSSLYHGTLKISVLDKSNNFLANLCFYYDNMPAPDQITAFLLDVKSGNENEIIKIGNLYNQSELIYDNQLLCELKDLRKFENSKIGNQNIENLTSIMENHLERVLPGSKFIRKYHDVTMPIAEKVVNKFYKEKMKLFDNLLVSYAPKQLEGH